MSVTKGPNLERKERREIFEEVESILESINEERLQEFEERGLSDEELAAILLELAVEKEGPTEFFGEPVFTNLQQDYFSNEAGPT
jgi:hypothetical protein